ncbi:MAG: OmpA family protein [Bdellovibrionales bacterium]|nr:OmpA family protein [Bdellovibrionales bacterium]
MIIKKLLKKHQPPEEPYALKEEAAHSGDAHDESNWLVSYADMMTLLCGFFIMMFSMARLDDPKYEAVKESIAKEFGGEYKSESKQLAEFATQILKEAGVETETTLQVTSIGVAIIFKSTVFFDVLSADVSDPGKALLNKLLTALSDREQKTGKKYQIVVEGHTDGRPVLSGPFPSNWELSAARATRVVRLFVEKGFEPKRLTAIGYGDTRPEIAHRTPSGEFSESGLQKNRRVVIRILDPKADGIPFADAATTNVENLTPEVAPASVAPATDTSSR